MIAAQDRFVPGVGLGGVPGDHDGLGHGRVDVLKNRRQTSGFAPVPWKTMAFRGTGLSFPEWADHWLGLGQVAPSVSQAQPAGQKTALGLSRR